MLNFMQTFSWYVHAQSVVIEFLVVGRRCFPRGILYEMYLFMYFPNVSNFFYFSKIWECSIRPPKRVSRPDHNLNFWDKFLMFFL